MAGLTEAQRRSFTRQVIELMAANKDALNAQGLNVTAKLADLQTRSAASERTEELQLKAMADAKAATAAAVKANKDAYELASAQADAMVGSLGKANALSQKIRKMRDAMSKVASRGKKKAKA